MPQTFIEIPENLPSLVEATYKHARSISKVIFAASEVAVITTRTGLPFQLRFCPSLAKKPTPGNDDKAKSKLKVNPFENPDPDLIIAQLPIQHTSHYLMLNKFPIIAEHFMLITRSPKEQTQKLEPDDLAATYACLRAWIGTTPEGRARRLFAFFNSGQHSGASQAHRHVQFLPVERMGEGLKGNDWDLLVDRFAAWPSSAKKPFRYWTATIPAEPSMRNLHDIYSTLFDQASSAATEFAARKPDQLELHDTAGGSSCFSYNLAMTTTTIMLCPRRSESIYLTREDSSTVGSVALNGTVLGGTLMVKHQEEWNFLRSQDRAMDAILDFIGIPIDDYKEDSIPDGRL